jgi:hypothetical protein
MLIIPILRSACGLRRISFLTSESAAVFNINRILNGLLSLIFDCRLLASSTASRVLFVEVDATNLDSKQFWLTESTGVETVITLATSSLIDFSFTSLTDGLFSCRLTNELERKEVWWFAVYLV